MFRELMQKLRGNPWMKVVQEREDAASGIVGGEDVGPLGDPTDFTADEEAPADPAP